MTLYLGWMWHCGPVQAPEWQLEWGPRLHFQRAPPSPWAFRLGLFGTSPAGWKPSFVALVWPWPQASRGRHPSPGCSCWDGALAGAPELCGCQDCGLCRPAYVLFPGPPAPRVPSRFHHVAEMPRLAPALHACPRLPACGHCSHTGELGQGALDWNHAYVISKSWTVVCSLHVPLGLAL